MEITNKEIEVVVKKKVKQFILNEKEMRALLLLVGPLTTSQTVEIMGKSGVKTERDNLFELARVLDCVYHEAWNGFNSN